ncbi:MAG: hypothetical protein NTW04_05225 [Elusimicrobia bacterium]|nr:hypothetical protein [Elusimicrobiota bacterium]
MKRVLKFACVAIVLAQFSNVVLACETTSKVDLPFVDDPQLKGCWEPVDAVALPDQFAVGKQSYGGKFAIDEMIFDEGGVVVNSATRNAFTWTKGNIIDSLQTSASPYKMKEIEGSKYLFIEWKTPGYIIAKEKPLYYVLKKTANIRRDNVNLPFVNDPRVIGTWKSVDFVDEKEQFPASGKFYREEMYFTELTFLEKGKTNKSWYGWTKGYVLHKGGDKTASAYEIREFDGVTYMFMEWKSGDYIYRGKKPKYYVLKKIS